MQVKFTSPGTNHVNLCLIGNAFEIHKLTIKMKMLLKRTSSQLK